MIGVSCTAFSADPPKEWLDRIVGEFELWEIFSEASHSVVYNFKEFRDLLPCYDLHYSIHAPICDINIASISDPVRKGSMKETLDTIKAANKLDIGRVTVHPGLSSMSVRGIEDRYIRRAKESMMILEKASHEYGITIAIENMPDIYFFLGRTAEDLAEIVDGTDLGICFDIGHANTAGQIDAMVDTFGDRIENVHIHDNKGKSDEHLTIGKGNIDFEHVISKLGSYSKNYVIESKTFESAVESQSALGPLLSSRS
jgi:sugar phosphate isomerase/epimerase